MTTARSDASSATLTPSTRRERIVALDILRGWAVFGMFIVHMTLSPWGVGVDIETSMLDQATFDIVGWFGHGRFVALFSFLFGLGFVIQRNRAAEKDSPFLGLYLRRLVGLLLISLVAYIFIPAGDALILYALFGIALPFAAIFPTRAVPLLVVSALAVASVAYQIVPVTPVVPFENPVDPGFMSFVVERVASMPGYFTSPLHFVLSFNVLALMLAGVWVGKLGLVESHDHQALTIKSATVVLVFTGTVVSAIAGLVPIDPSGARVLRLVGSMLLGLGYAGVILWLLQRSYWQKFLRPLADVGRMAFTNYLLNSAIGMYLFHPIGLGLAGQFGPFLGMLIGIAVFLIQMRLSTLWLHHFRFGPVEWLWRTITYGSIGPMRRTPQGATASVPTAILPPPSTTTK